MLSSEIAKVDSLEEDDLSEELSTSSKSTLEVGKPTTDTADNVTKNTTEVVGMVTENTTGIVDTVTEAKGFDVGSAIYSLFAMLAPSYKSKTDDFRKTFKDIPHEERLIVDYSCALQKDILVQGRMYVTQNWVCFYANIFRWETVLTIPCKEITAVTKEKTARVIPNAIAITTDREKYFFTSFGARDKTFMMLFRIWQNALLDQPMNPKELWQWIHYSYGEELGLTSSDDDYVPPPGMDDLRERLSKDDSIPSKGDLTQIIANDDTDVLVSDQVLCPPIGLLPSDVPTDFGDTTEDDTDIDGFTEEVTCTGHEHLEKCYLDEVFNFDVDRAFEFLFTDSTFFRQFVASRKTFDLVLPDWSEVDGNGCRTRIINYTLTLNHSIGPKTSPSTEKQTCIKDSEPGVQYLVDTDCMNGGIPYADAFYVANRYCLTRMSRSKCRVHVSTDVRYKKSVIGIVRSMIERSAVGGLTDYFRALSAHLRREAERMEHISSIGQTSTKKKLRRRRKIIVGSGDVPSPLRKPDRLTSIPPSPAKGLDLRGGYLSQTAMSWIRFIIFIMSVLVVANAVLFFKVLTIESIAQQSCLLFPSKELDNIQDLPQSQEQWSRLLSQQHLLQERDMDKWRDVLSTSIHIMEQLKGTLEHLRNGIDVQQGKDRNGKTKS